MADSMIERVARALMRHKMVRDGHPQGPALDVVLDYEWEKFSDYARVAITALNEPAQAMAQAGADELIDGTAADLTLLETKARACFKAMIKAALTP